MKVLVWHQSSNLLTLGRALDVLKKIYGEIEVLGLSDSAKYPPPSAMCKGQMLRSIDQTELRSLDPDLIVVSGDNASLSQALSDAAPFGFDPDKFILDRTICVPGFSVERYTRLRHSDLTIFSMNCWGGLTYHTFGLPFRSPTINMFTGTSDFINFAQTPAKYVTQPPHFVKFAYDLNLKNKYPVVSIGDVTWQMNHYRTFEEAASKWTQRAPRINWSNVLTVMYTDEPAALEEFDQLPLEKKVCYTSFETKLKSGFYIEPRLIPRGELWRAVNDSARNKLARYDLWDILLDGKKTPLKG